MGHLSLRTLPRSHRWQEVVQLLEEEGSPKDMAQASFEAAQTGHSQVARDPRFGVTLTEILAFVASVRKKEPVQALWEKGFAVSSDASLSA